MAQTFPAGTSGARGSTTGNQVKSNLRAVSGLIDNHLHIRHGRQSLIVPRLSHDQAHFAGMGRVAAPVRDRLPLALLQTDGLDSSARRLVRSLQSLLSLDHFEIQF